MREIKPNLEKLTTEDLESYINYLRHNGGDPKTIKEVEKELEIRDANKNAQEDRKLADKKAQEYYKGKINYQESPSGPCEF